MRGEDGGRGVSWLDDGEGKGDGRLRVGRGAEGMTNGGSEEGGNEGEGKGNGMQGEGVEGREKRGGTCPRLQPDDCEWVGKGEQTGKGERGLPATAA